MIKEANRLNLTLHTVFEQYDIGKLGEYWCWYMRGVYARSEQRSEMPQKQFISVFKKPKNMTSTNAKDIISNILLHCDTDNFSVFCYSVQQKTYPVINITTF